jgi:hypothetical protein
VARLLLANIQPLLGPASRVWWHTVQDLLASLVRMLEDGSSREAEVDEEERDDESVLWQARSLSAAEWHAGFSSGLVPTTHAPRPLRALMCT